MSEKTYVAIGCSRDRDYSFLLPLTCLFWRDVIGYTPIAFLAGSSFDWQSTPPTNVVLNALVHDLVDGLAIRFIGAVEGYPEHTAAQNVRQHAAVVPVIADDAWIMPADADLWPLKKAFYHQHEGTPHRAVCYYGNGDHFQGKDVTMRRVAQGLRTQTIPTCHVAMRAKDWREIYSLDSAANPAAHIKRTLDSYIAARAPGGDAGMDLWMSDQQIMTEALCQQTWFPQMALMVERRGHPPVDRLCRSVLEYWQEPFDPARWTDAHLHKSPESDEHWAYELQIIRALMPQHAEWAQQYRDEYVRA